MIYFATAIFYYFITFAASKYFRVPIYPAQRWEDSFVSNTSNEGYYVELDIGIPHQKINVLIDTGSSNFAVLAIANSSVRSDTYFQYNKSSTFHTEGKYISVEYTVGSWKALLGKENVSVPSLPQSLTVNTNLACIVKSENFFTALSKWQGILGMAYPAVAKPTTLTPFFDSLVQSKQIDNIFSIAMCGPFVTAEDGKSEMVLGGIEKELYQGEIFYTPVYQEWYYEVVLVDIAVGEEHWPKECYQLNAKHTIVDTGTSDVLLPPAVFSWVVEAMKTEMEGINISEQFWDRSQELCSPYGAVFDLNFPVIRLSLFHHEKKKFTLLLTPEMYLRRSHKGMIDCYVLALGPSDRGTILGAALLKGYYIVFDRKNKQVGFANLTCLSASSHLLSGVEGLQMSEKDIKDCIYIHDGETGETGFHIAAYVVATLCLLCAIPLITLLMHWIWTRLIKRRLDSSECSSLIDETDRK